MKTPPPARIHLLPAKAAPCVVVIRRKPTKWFHILRWNTETDAIESGSWFQGTIYPEHADVSFDGEWMIFLALDEKVDAWTGITNPPWLDKVIKVRNFATYYGGGYWKSATTLKENGDTYSGWPYLKADIKERLPFQIEKHEPETYPGDWGGMLYARLRRDGWIQYQNTQSRHDMAAGEVWFEDDGWLCRPTDHHPILRMQYVWHTKNSSRLPFKFWLDEYPNLIPEMADWACWDALGQLIFVDRGVLYKYTCASMIETKPTTVIDLEHLTPPSANT